MILTFKAMQFAKASHAGQTRKYTGNPYWNHLAEVAGIVAACGGVTKAVGVSAKTMIAVAWLHDCMEDCGVTMSELRANFSDAVAIGVSLLSDMETGNRAKRKAASRERLSASPDWVQTIKCADLISNTSSIVQHDPEFAKVYLEEKRLLLDCMTRADRRLLQIAREQVAL